jgi:hypothetical protein
MFLLSAIDFLMIFDGNIHKFQTSKCATTVFGLAVGLAAI